MLHAIHKNKTRVYNRYKGHPTPDEKRVSEEDEITSIVFSPLTFMSPEDNAYFWHFISSKKLAINKSSPPLSSTIEMWPSRTSSETGNRIEPEILINLIYPDTKITLIVELKWNAPLSENQLQKQWCNFLESAEQENGVQIFIGRDTSTAIKAKEEPDKWIDPNKLIILSWSEIIALLGSEDFKGSEILKSWSKLLCDFMSKLGIRAFKGFNELSDPHPVKITEPIFFHNKDRYDS